MLSTFHHHFCGHDHDSWAAIYLQFLFRNVKSVLCTTHKSSFKDFSSIIINYSRYRVQNLWSKSREIIPQTEIIIWVCMACRNMHDGGVWRRLAACHYNINSTPPPPAYPPPSTPSPHTAPLVPVPRAILFTVYLYNRQNITKYIHFPATIYT